MRVYEDHKNKFLVNDVRCKSDLSHKHEVPNQEGMQFASSRFKYFVISSNSNCESVDNLFDHIFNRSSFYQKYILSTLVWSLDNSSSFILTSAKFMNK